MVSDDDVFCFEGHGCMPFRHIDHLQFNKVTRNGTMNEVGLLAGSYFLPLGIARGYVNVLVEMMVLLLVLINVDGCSFVLA